MLAALALSEFGTIDSQAGAKKNVRAAIEKVSSKLGNTATICRKCYVHPEVLNSYMSGDLLLELKEEVDTELRENLPSLKPEEAAVLALLERRLQHEIQGQARVGALSGTEHCGRPDTCCRHHRCAIKPGKARPCKAP